MRLRQRRTTVIIPTYQGQNFLSEALNSIAHDLLGDLEVIVIDDGSTDATVQIARSFESRLPLRVLRPNRRANWVAITNIGLSEATGAWSCILHQDDKWLPGRREAHALAASSGIQNPMVWMQTAMINEDSKAIGNWRFPYAVRSNLESLTDMPLSASLFIQNWLAVPSVIFSTALARNSGGMDEDLWYTADWDLWLRLLRNGPPIALPHVGSAFRIHKKAQTILRSRDTAAFREQMITVQTRHGWAAQTSHDPEMVRRAGALSTETNAALASGLHLQRYEFAGWARSFAQAGMAGFWCYLQNASLIDRLAPRVRLAMTGLLDPKAALWRGPHPPNKRISAR